ncbi:uncharacterized protein LOC107419791 [Ziziphus jujuba]|uniref:DNA 5'-3' helicase FANCJ n=1 Tax=Ziziphus jujuba TaxID=326968 RepID=A0A6P3ZVU1_ZIZJJ|nr:uncharacterized protein LOC107419791 [Ziziphus jujuba]
MVSATPAKNHKNVYHIGGVQVEFPYRPYGTQLAFMGRVISTLERAHKDGHCHAILESPTGTGKSLSLLCSTLAWLQNYKFKNQFANLSHSKPDPEAMTDPLGHGGGFVPEDEPSSAPVVEASGPAKSIEKSKNQKKRPAPIIYYASRTHSQISQVIREYRKTGYRVPMAVLASRKHYCTNAYVHGKENIDEECKLLLKNREVGCPEFKNVHKVKCHPSLQKGGCHEAHDIEDLVKVGKVVRGCSYYAARSMAGDAQLVFCPYNYIINPVIRGAMEVDIKGAIVVLDEAHNIEDIARDAGSMDVEEDVLHKLQMELGQLWPNDASMYQPLYEMTQDLISWIEQRKSMLEKREFQHYVSCWTGDKALRELQEANISQQSFPILLECATKAIKAASDTESEVPHLSGLAVTTLEGLFSSLTYFFSRNGCHMFDYQLALRRYVKRDGGKAFGEWTHTLSLWCLNPSVVFRDIAELSFSVILTSGTLSPMNSFSSELGIHFETSLEAAHVIDVNSQVWPAIISTGPGNFPLNASYKTADGYAFQDALGKSLEDIFKTVQGGCLVFFPSYKLMDKLCKRWCETGQWSQLNAKKPLFVEPRGGSQDDFESVLKGYYDSIRYGNRPLPVRRKKVKKMGLTHLSANHSVENTKSQGAAFLAVCRGKVSEGIDFSDDNARVVIIVGIPFPNTNDIQVALKKKYNDTYKSSKNLLSGSEWYCNQAFRALNQAAGRCIRHRFDYGAIILLDERYREERNRAYVSKWLRNSIKQYDSFDLSLEGLKSFFTDVKEHVDKKMVSVSQNYNVSDENITFMDQSRGVTTKENQKMKRSEHCGQKGICVANCNASFPQLESQDNATVQVQASLRLDENADNLNEIIDLECSPQKDSGFPMVFSLEDPEGSIVKETPCVGSPEPLDKGEYSSSTIIEDQLSFHSASLPYSKASSPTQCSMLLTPEKDATVNFHSLIPETESSLNSSVNSHTQKRRKSTFSPCSSLVEEEHNVHNAKAPSNRDANRRIEFGVDINCTENKLDLHVPKLLTLSHHDVSSGPLMDKRVQVFCSLCKNSLGLPENHQYIMCSSTSISKIHLESLHKNTMNPQTKSTSTDVPVLVTDVSSVHQQLCSRSLEADSGQGIWCEKDGCVFNTIFCPFCSMRNNCLGVQVMATNASSIHLLNKILFYMDRLEIKNPEAASIEETQKDEKNLPVRSSSMDRVSILNSFDKFAYIKTQHDSGGWRTTKSKLKLPKRG